jgi:iron complex outermembrane receptor protein
MYVRSTLNRLTAFGVGAISCFLAVPSVQAQIVLEEIIVTAQKREENIQEVPISITNMTGDRLTARFSGGEDALALASAAPGLHVESSNGRSSPRFYLRGLGNADFTQAASQPVSVVFDEVPMEKVGFKAFPLFDMDRIEVIRGPQGTLFGRNTTAGIVKVDTRRPTDELEGYVRANVGNLGTFNFEGAVGGPLVEDKLLARVSVLTQNRSDWVNNGFTGEDDAMGGHNIHAGRVQLLWTPTDNFSVLLLHQMQNSDSTASIFRANVFNQGSNDLNENYDRDTVWLDGGDNNPAIIKSTGTNLRLDWDLENHTITSITSYQDIFDRFARADIDGGFGCALAFACTGPAGPPSTPFNPFASPFAVNIDTGSSIDVEQLTQELRIASNLDGAFNYQFGAFYFEDQFDLDAQSQNAGAPTFATNSTSSIENTTWAVFGQGSWDVSDQLSVTAGVRYTDDEKDALHVDFSGVIPTVPINLSDDNVSWDVALAYGTGDESQIYGRVASGFRAPTVQDRIQDDVEITVADSETILSYEIGYKAQSDRVRFNVAGFYYVVDDMQLVIIGGAVNQTKLENADEGVGYGVEVELDYAVTENLILSGGFGYNKTEINDSNLSVTPGPMTTPLDPLDPSGGPRDVFIDGNPFQHAPEWTANIEIDYTYPLTSGNELYLFTDWKFKGETNDFLYRTLEFVTDTQFEGGLRLGYRNVDKNYSIGLFGRNITDEDNAIGGIDFANNLGYVNEPRIYGVEASYSF